MAVKKLKNAIPNPPYFRRAEGKEQWKSNRVPLYPMSTIIKPNQSDIQVFNQVLNAWRSIDQIMAHSRCEEAANAFTISRIVKGPEVEVDPFCIFFIRYSEDKGWL